MALSTPKTSLMFGILLGLLSGVLFTIILGHLDTSDYLVEQLSIGFVEIPFISDIYRSRFENFNLAAIDAVMKASESFPPLPSELEKDRQYFDMVIEFRD